MKTGIQINFIDCRINDTEKIFFELNNTLKTFLHQSYMLLDSTESVQKLFL